MKRSKNKKYRNQKSEQFGSITVFLTLIMLSVILLTGSMVDVSRIMVADNKMDSAIRAATKSLMSEYDKELYAHYGLLGVEAEANKDIFYSYFEKNLNLSNTAFIEYEPVPEAAKIIPTDDLSLSNTDCLQQQINEYMKYKGPVNFGVRAFDRFKNVFKVFMKSQPKVKYKADKEKLNLDKITENKKDYKITSGTSSSDMKKINENLGNIKQEIKDETKKVEDAAIKTKKAFSEMLNEINDDGVQANFKGEEYIVLITNVQEKAAECEKLQSDLEEELAKPEESKNDAKIEKLNQDIKVKIYEYEDAYEELEKKAKQNVVAKYAGELSKIMGLDGNSMAKSINSLADVKEKFDNIKDNLNGLTQTVEGIESSTETDFSKIGLINKFIDKKNEITNLFTESDDRNIGLYDKFLDIEYALDRFTYATSSVEREHALFKFGEVEYLINGFSVEGANIFASLFKMFLVCLVIEIIDWIYIVSHPVVAIVAGIVTAAIAALILLNGGVYVPFNKFFFKHYASKFSEIKGMIGLSYMDFLYMQLLFKGKDELLGRMQNLIRANKNKIIFEHEGTLKGLPDLSIYKTGVKTQAGAKINLLFLPIFPLEAAHLKGFKDGSYEIRKTYEFQYQKKH